MVGLVQMDVALLVLPNTWHAVCALEDATVGMGDAVGSIWVSRQIGARG
jgi:hypothetical protein